MILPPRAAMRRSLLVLATMLGAGAAAAQTQPGTPADSSTVSADGGFVIRMTPPGSYIDSVLVDFAGVRTSGFEENRLTPCGEWTPDSLGGVPFIPGRIGMGRSVEGYTYDDAIMPNLLARRPEGSMPALYFRGKGWLVGPGVYDHLGMNRYRIRTVHFDEVRWAMPGECGVEGR